MELTFHVTHREGQKYGKTIMYTLEGFDFKILANRLGVGVFGGMPMTDDVGVAAIIEVLRRAQYHSTHLLRGFLSNHQTFLKEGYFETQEWRDAVQEQSPATLHVCAAPPDRPPLGEGDTVVPAAALARAEEEGPGEGEPSTPVPAGPSLITPVRRRPVQIPSFPLPRRKQ